MTARRVLWRPFFADTQVDDRFDLSPRATALRQVPELPVFRLELPVFVSINAPGSLKTTPLSVPASPIVAQAQRRLKESSYPAHRWLRCSFREGALTLQGRVSSYYLRQTACALVADMEGVECVVDRMEVVEPARRR